MKILFSLNIWVIMVIQTCLCSLFVLILTITYITSLYSKIPFAIHLTELKRALMLGAVRSQNQLPLLIVSNVQKHCFLFHILPECHQTMPARQWVSFLILPTTAVYADIGTVMLTECLVWRQYGPRHCITLGFQSKKIFPWVLTQGGNTQ